MEKPSSPPCRSFYYYSFPLFQSLPLYFLVKLFGMENSPARKVGEQTRKAMAMPLSELEVHKNAGRDRFAKTLFNQSFEEKMRVRFSVPAKLLFQIFLLPRSGWR